MFDTLIGLPGIAIEGTEKKSKKKTTSVEVC